MLTCHRQLIGGRQIGCNYQFAPNWVGIEGSGSASGIKGDATDTFLNNKSLHAKYASGEGRLAEVSFWVKS
jgi:hypothetical protein